MTTPGGFGSNFIEFSSDPSRLYGSSIEVGLAEFRRMTVAADGVRLDDLTPLPFAPLGDIEFQDGRVYATSGLLISPEPPQLVGTFSSSFTFLATVEPDAAAGRVFFMAGSGLLTFDSVTLARVGVPFTVPGVVNPTSNLLRWGDDGLAFSDMARVFLLRPPFEDTTFNEIDHAKAISGLPFGETADTRQATMAFDDPFCSSQGTTVRCRSRRRAPFRSRPTRSAAAIPPRSRCGRAHAAR